MTPAQRTGQRTGIQVQYENSRKIGQNSGSHTKAAIENNNNGPESLLSVQAMHSPQPFDQTLSSQWGTRATAELISRSSVRAPGAMVSKSRQNAGE